MLCNPHDHKRALLACPEVKLDSSQQLALAEMEVEPTQTLGIVAEAREPISGIAKPWGWGYALANSIHKYLSTTWRD